MPFNSQVLFIGSFRRKPVSTLPLKLVSYRERHQEVESLTKIFIKGNEFYSVYSNHHFEELLVVHDLS